jgi:hypothetical protein
MAGTISRGAASRTSLQVGLIGAAVVAAVFAVLVAGSFVGFIESDDLEYALNAIAWLDSPPHLGESHWGLRHLIVLPIAASFAVLGRGEVGLLAPTVLYSAAIVALMGLCVARVAGVVAGVLAALLVVSLPVVLTGASMVYSDTTETFFVLASVWAYWFATRSGNPWLFVASGVLAGGAFITRETTVALLGLYAVLFLMAPRRIMDFVRMGAGFLAVAGLDTALLWAASGDPLWRLSVSSRGVAGDNPALAHFQMNTGGLDRHGVIVAPRPIQALLAIFANQLMGLLPWAAVPAAIALARRPKPADPAQADARSAALHFAGLALVWFLLLSYAFTFMWIVPRYQTVTMVALCVPLSIWLAGRIEAGAWRLPALLVLGILGCGAALALVADRELLFGERGLVAFARTTQGQGPIRTDPATLRGADWLLQVEGLRGRVSAGPCEPGLLCYVNPGPRRTLPAGWVRQEVPPGAQMLLEVPRGRSMVAVILARTGLLSLMPGAVRGKLDGPALVARGFRMPG